MWTKPLYRQATSEYFHYLHATEEIQYLDVEIQCLQTSIQDEHTMMSKAINNVALYSNPLAEELCHQWLL